MKRLSNALIVGVLGFVIHASSASAQYVVATNQPVVVVPGQTQARFTGHHQAYVRSFNCVGYTMIYLQGIVMETPGLPAPPGDPAQVLQVFTTGLGDTGRLYTVCGSLLCDGYQFLDVEPSGWCGGP